MHSERFLKELWPDLAFRRWWFLVAAGLATAPFAQLGVRCLPLAAPWTNLFAHLIRVQVCERGSVDRGDTLAGIGTAGSPQGLLCDLPVNGRYGSFQCCGDVIAADRQFPGERADRIERSKLRLEVTGEWFDVDLPGVLTGSWGMAENETAPAALWIEARNFGATPALTGLPGDGLYGAAASPATAIVGWIDQAVFVLAPHARPCIRQGAFTPGTDPVDGLHVVVAAATVLLGFEFGVIGVEAVHLPERHVDAVKRCLDGGTVKRDVLDPPAVELTDVDPHLAGKVFPVETGKQLLVEPFPERCRVESRARHARLPLPYVE